MKLAFILITLILVGCEKPYNKNVVNVHAYNALDSSGIEGVYVAVYKEPNGDLGKEKTAADGYTNSAGELTLTYKKFKLFKAFQLYDFFDNENYEKIKMYRNGVEWNGEGQTGGTKVTDFEIVYAQLANYKVHLKNENCFGANDILDLNRIYSLTGDTVEFRNYVVGVGFENYSGCFDKLQTDFIKIPAGNYRYVGSITRDNGTTEIDTTIFIAPDTDNFVELFF